MANGNARDIAKHSVTDFWMLETEINNMFASSKGWNNQVIFNERMFASYILGFANGFQPNDSSSSSKCTFFGGKIISEM